MEEPTAETAGIVTGLAELPREAYLDARALGRLIGRCKKSVERATRRGELPPPIRFMGRNVWLVGAILDHFMKRQDAALKRARGRDDRIARLGP